MTYQLLHEYIFKMHYCNALIMNLITKLSTFFVMWGNGGMT